MPLAGEGYPLRIDISPGDEVGSELICSESKIEEMDLESTLQYIEIIETQVVNKAIPGLIEYSIDIPIPLCRGIGRIPATRNIIPRLPRNVEHRCRRRGIHNVGIVACPANITIYSDAAVQIIVAA